MQPARFQRIFVDDVTHHGIPPRHASRSDRTPNSQGVGNASMALGVLEADDESNCGAKHRDKRPWKGQKLPIETRIHERGYQGPKRQAKKLPFGPLEVL